MVKLYCCECESETSFDEAGYCNSCGEHADNVACSHRVVDEEGVTVYEGSEKSCKDYIRRPWNSNLSLSIH